MVTAEQVRVFGEAAISIFAIVNPIGGLPVFVSLTEDTPPHERRRVFRLAGATALVIISVMALAGQFLMNDVFQVGMEEFAFGGGLLLVVIGIRSLLERPEQRQAGLVDDSARRLAQVRLAVSPIASPLLVGPGAIVTVMLIVNQHGRLFALGACLVAFVFVILILNYAHLLYRLMRPVGSLAIGRVMQIFIVAIGVKFCFQALAKVFPGLVGP
ncbi:MAG: MarC family protein [Planctomycetes bacterium]|nr:MarC family protein [Planctomycetota bacterium]